MTKASEPCDEKTIVSARVNSTAVAILKQNEIPVSDVIEAGIIHFLYLDDQDKVAFLLKNNSDVMNIDDFKAPHALWSECIKQVLGLSNVTDVKAEVKNFKAVAKWLPDRGATRLSQLNMQKLDSKEIVKKANDLVLTGHLQEALSYYDYAFMLYKKSGNPREIGKISIVIGDAYRDLGNFSLALAAYEGAEAYFEKENKSLDLANLAYSRGICHQLWGHHKESFNYFEQARILFQSIDDAAGCHKTISRMALSFHFIDPEEALKLCDHFIEMINQKKSQYTQELTNR